MEIKIIVPSYVLPELCKFVGKSKKYLPEIGISYSESRDQRFRHTVYDPDGHVFITKMVHNVQDVKIIVPDDNKWRLMVSYFDDLAFVADKSKELELQGEHGINYRTCDVCGHWCKNSYVIRNIETGEELQVGSECAKKVWVKPD